MYDFDRDRYPMYFKELIIKADDVKINKVKNQETTTFLQRDIMSWDQYDLISPGNIVLSQRDRTLIAPKIDLIRKVTSDRNGKAITPALYLNALTDGDFPKRERAIIPRLISGLYVAHYTNELRSRIPSGALGVEVNDLENGYPEVDINLLMFILEEVGLYRQTFRTTRDYPKQIVENYSSKERCRIADLCSALILSAHSLTNNADSRADQRIQIKNLLAPHIEAEKRNTRSASLRDFLLVTRRTLDRIVESLSAENENFATAYSRFGKKRLNMQKILLHTATDLEDDLMREVFSSHDIQLLDRRRAGNVFVSRYEFGETISLYHVRSSMGMIGPNSAGYTLFNVLKDISPTHIISAGICFGLKRNEQNIGDIVFSDGIQDYDTGKDKKEGFEYRGERVPADALLLSLARHSRDSFTEFRAHGGLFLSGPHVVNNEKTVQSLLGVWPDAKAGDMEASAVFAAAFNLNIGMIMVKGICDWGFDKEDTDQRKAAKNAFSYVVKMLQIMASANYPVSH